MNANEAPEKLYLSKNIYSTYMYQVPDPDDDTAVEYTRTDTFMKKACAWLKENGGSYWMDDYDLPTDELVNDFKKYMKGE